MIHLQSTEVRNKWVLRGAPALVDSTSPPYLLVTPDHNLRLVTLLPCSPDFNPDEAIWDWARQEVTANRCFGTAANVGQHIDALVAGLATRTDEVMSRCRRELQSSAEAAIATIRPASACTQHVDLTLDSV